MFLFCKWFLKEEESYVEDIDKAINDILNPECEK